MPTDEKEMGERVARIEERMSSLENRIKEITENHLAHITAQIQELSDRKSISYPVATLITILTNLVVGLVIFTLTT